MNEACLNLLGENVASERGLTFSLRTMDFINGQLSEMQEETRELFNLEATPAERRMRESRNMGFHGDQR